jgi:predicted DNA-binding transcriptional regulator AlpA
MSDTSQTRKLKPGDRLIDLREVSRLLGGAGKTFIYNAMKDRGFPSAIKLGKNSRWIETEVIEWCNKSIAESTKAVA